MRAALLLLIGAAAPRGYAYHFAVHGSSSSFGCRISTQMRLGLTMKDPTQFSVLRALARTDATIQRPSMPSQQEHAQVIEIEIPEGFGPNDVMQVAFGGVSFHVTVPVTCAAGDLLRVTVPTPDPEECVVQEGECEEEEECTPPAEEEELTCRESAVTEPHCCYGRKYMYISTDASGAESRSSSRYVHSETRYACVTQPLPPGKVCVSPKKSAASRRSPDPKAALTDFFRLPGSGSGAGGGSAAAAIEARLLEGVTGDGVMTTAEALTEFAALEAAKPARSDLLLTADGAAMLDGRWLLLSTIAAQVGDDGDDTSLASSGVSGAVNASGIVIDASSARAPVQEVDLANQRIGNEIRFDLPVGGASVVVRVAGGFEADAQIGNRALVSFDTLDVFFLGGGTGATARRVLRAGALFSAVRSLKPALANGADDASWLDTTYISERARLGRGNKGSVFILERSDDTGADAAPLASFPL